MTSAAASLGDLDLATRMGGVTFADLSEPQPDSTKTAVELSAPARRTPRQAQWLEDGFVKLPRFIPAELRAAYSEARERALPKDRAQRDNYWGGWHHPTPYLDCPELQAVALHRPLTEILRELMGVEMGLHLALTGWVSTERNFHQDTYLNPPDLWSHYVAVWIALDDVHADAGPFQYVRGSHRWDVLRRERLFARLTETERSNPSWPSFTQEWVARACEEEIARRGAKVEEFVPEGGDVLIWHSSLIHRGSVPKNPELLRKSLICHFSSIEHRRDFSDVRRRDDGSCYFHFPPPGSTAPSPPAPRPSLLRRLFGG